MRFNQSNKRMLLKRLWSVIISKLKSINKLIEKLENNNIKEE